MYNLYDTHNKKKTQKKGYGEVEKLLHHFPPHTRPWLRQLKYHFFIIFRIKKKKKKNINLKKSQIIFSRVFIRAERHTAARTNVQSPPAHQFIILTAFRGEFRFALGISHNEKVPKSPWKFGRTTNTGIVHELINNNFILTTEHYAYATDTTRFGYIIILRDCCFSRH